MSVDCSDSDLTDLADKIRDFHTDVSSRVGRTSAAALVPWLTAVCVRTPGPPSEGPGGRAQRIPAFRVMEVPPRSRPGALGGRSQTMRSTRVARRRYEEADHVRVRYQGG